MLMGKLGLHVTIVETIGLESAGTSSTPPPPPQKKNFLPRMRSPRVLPCSADRKEVMTNMLNRVLTEASVAVELWLLSQPHSSYPGRALFKVSNHRHVDGIKHNTLQNIFRLNTLTANESPSSNI